jgi:hypothetical protein
VPSNATNTTIEWTVKTGAGTTAPGAAIADGKPTATGLGTVTVTAAIANGASALTPYTGDSIITVYTEGILPRVTSVTVSPASATVEKGGTQTFTAVVSGDNSPSQAVSWSITTPGIHAGTTIDSTGKLTVAAAETKTALK